MLSTLTQQDLSSATDLVARLFDTEMLIGLLSEQGVYLGVQDQLTELSRSDAHHLCARFVVMIFGDQLLSNKVLRGRLCDAFSIPTRNWSPGSHGAVELCEEVGLPQVFAGGKVFDHQDPIEQVPPPIRLPPLQDYQVEVVEKVLEAVAAGESSVMLSLPTGAGKTRVATEILRALHDDNERRTAVWIAHTEELCEQAIRCIKEMWEHRPTAYRLNIYRSWGSKLKAIQKSVVHLDADADEIVVSTPTSMMNILTEPSWSTIAGTIRNTRCVIIDEAHRAAAATYRNLLARLDDYAKDAVFRLGLSATPIRETYTSRPYRGTQQLSSVFATLIEPLDSLGATNDPALELQRRGILSALNVHRVHRPQDTLADTAEHISQLIAPPQRDTGTLIFTNTAGEAKVLAMYLTDLGFSSEYVSSDTNSYERLEIIERLRSKRVQALCNCEILTTGFDAPHISNIVLMRQTQSPVLYKQMIGRGMRGEAHGGSSACNLFLYNVVLPFPENPNTIEFARAIWAS